MIFEQRRVMFSKCSNFFVRSTVKGIRTYNNRMFSNSIPAPHSKEFLELQKKLFQFKKIPVEVTFLSRGTQLIGLNITQAEPHFLSTAPVYQPQILKSLSQNEKQEWLKMAKNYYAQVGQYELLCDVNCLTSKSENGISMYYIDHSLLEAKSYNPLNLVVEDLKEYPKSDF